MSRIKEKLQEAKQSTKVAFIGGAIVVAGTWGSCELQLDEQAPEAPEAAPAAEPEPAPAEEPEAAPEAEEAAEQAAPEAETE